MERFEEALQFIYNLNESFGLTNAEIDRMRETWVYQNVYIPVLGGTNAGKSALINALLCGRKNLKEGIDPVTKIPTEVIGCEEEYAVLCGMDGMEQDVSVKDYRTVRQEPDMIQYTKLYLDNEFLRQIQNIIIVDTPGFDSDCWKVNGRMERYFAESIAFMILLPADHLAGALTSSFAALLKTLCQYEALFCFVLTKCDKVNEESDGFLDAKQYFFKWLRKYMDGRELECCHASVVYQSKLSELKEFLQCMQENSGQILMGKRMRFVLGCMERTEDCLKNRLRDSEMSKAVQKKEKIDTAEQMEVFDRQIALERDKFFKQASACAEKIVLDICQNLRKREELFVTMAGNNQSPDAQIMDTVRQSLADGIESRFLPDARRFQRHMRRIMEKQQAYGKKQQAHGYKIQMEIDDKKVKQDMQGVIGELKERMIFPGSDKRAVFLFSGWYAQQEEMRENYRIELQKSFYPQMKEIAGQLLEDFFHKQAEKQNEFVMNCQKELQNNTQEENEKMTDGQEDQIRENLKKIEGWKEEFRENLKEIEGWKEELYGR